MIFLIIVAAPKCNSDQSLRQFVILLEVKKFFNVNH